MKKIRRNVFETNSSSCHSIALSNGNDALLDTTLIPNDDGVINIQGGEYGWQWERYNDARTKASYLLTLSSTTNDNDLKNLVIRDVKEYTGAHDVVFEEGEYSYVDHQSQYDYSGEDIRSLVYQDRIKEFIFDSRWYLFLGNDNSRAPNKFYDINNKAYKYRLVIEGRHWDFIDEPSLIDVQKALEGLDYDCGRKYIMSYVQYSNTPLDKVLDIARKTGERAPMYGGISDDDNYHSWEYQGDVDMERKVVLLKSKNTWINGHKRSRGIQEGILPELPPLELPFSIEAINDETSYYL